MRGLECFYETVRFTETNLAKTRKTTEEREEKERTRSSWARVEIEKDIQRRSLVKPVVVLVPRNYNIATEGHSKTVVYNRLRMCNVKYKSYSIYYKIATAPYSKTVIDNCLRTHVVENRFCSSVNCHQFTLSETKMVFYLILYQSNMYIFYNHHN